MQLIMFSFFDFVFQFFEASTLGNHLIPCCYVVVSLSDHKRDFYWRRWGNKLTVSIYHSVTSAILSELVYRGPILKPELYTCLLSYIKTGFIEEKKKAYLVSGFKYVHGP